MANATKRPKWEIVGLVGHYCSNCVQTLIKFRCRSNEILAMCHEDLDQFLHNGDYDRVGEMIKRGEQHESK